MKIQLKGREIPRNESGDPSFKYLGPPMSIRPIGSLQNEQTVIHPKTVREVFNDDEVVELVNRALYQLEYQHTSHKRRGAELRAREKAVREKVKELFHTSWMKATPEQIIKAREEVEKGRDTGKG